MRNYYVKDNSLAVNGIYTAFQRKAESGYLFSGETHDFWEMMYCIEGSATVTSGDRVVTLTEDQCIFFRPMEFHSFRVEENVNSLFFIISFSAEGEAAKKLGGKIFHLDRELNSRLSAVIDLLDFDSETSEQENLAQHFLKKLSSVNGGMNLLINSFENFLIELSGRDVTKANIPDNSETKIYTDALRHIDAHTADSLTVDRLARLCNVSSTYLKKLFRKYNGLGIHRYITKNKISLARKMLAEGKPVASIAEELGFSSSNYFSTVFKREMGISPLEYKSGDFFEYY